MSVNKKIDDAIETRDVLNLLVNNTNNLIAVMGIIPHEAKGYIIINGSVEHESKLSMYVRDSVVDEVKNAIVKERLILLRRLINLEDADVQLELYDYLNKVYGNGKS